MHDYAQVIEQWENVFPKIEPFQSQPLSETDTRCAIIDPILIDVFGWDNDRIKREPKVDSGYIDYLCKGSDNKFVIEAKRTAKPFRMPSQRLLIDSSKIATSAPELFDAINQAKNYAKEKNCEFFVVSNGLNFSITKTYPEETGPDTLVFAGKDSIDKNLHILYEILSPYKSGYQFLLGILHSKGNIRSKPQFRGTILQNQYHSDVMVSNNQLAPYLSPYIDKYLKELTDPTLIRQLYCNTDKLGSYGEQIKRHLSGRIPFYGTDAQQLVSTTGSAGAFGVSFRLGQQNGNGRVFFLIGNIGAGKSIFLDHFYYNILDNLLKSKIVWVRINFLGYDQKSDVRKFIYREFMKILRSDYGELKLLSWENLCKIYSEEIEFKKAGPWYPYLNNEDELNKKISNLIESSMTDEIDFMDKVMMYIKKIGYEVCMAFDNVDQLSVDLQKEISYLATTSATAYKCIFIVSLRDETFWYIRSNAEMNAYANFQAYQVVPPEVGHVIGKRLDYIRGNIQNRPEKERTQWFDVDVPGAISSKGVQMDIGEAFSVIQNTVNTHSTKELFEYLSSGNIRYALQLLERLITSGHTDMLNLAIKVGAQTSRKRIYKDGVLKSIALSDYAYYNSNKSVIVNLFKVFDDGFHSHFVSLRILEILFRFKDVSTKPSSNVSDGYVPVQELFEHVKPYCRNENALRQCLKPLLENYLVDSDIGSRKNDDQNYFERIEFIKISIAGQHYLNSLVGDFEYLELIMNDTEIRYETSYKLILDGISKVREVRKDREQRWLNRFRAVEAFLEYLSQCEEDDYRYLNRIGDNGHSRIIPMIKKMYEKSKNDLKTRLNLVK